MLSAAAAQRIVSAQQISVADGFEACSLAASMIAKRGREDPRALDLTIRIIDALKAERLPAELNEMVNALTRASGLFPHVEQDELGSFDQVAVEAHRVRGGMLTLHTKQMEILLRLLAGENVVLSAPTSFGKSAMVDTFISIKRPQTVVIVVPTIALIDETRRRLERHFSSAYSVIFHREQLVQNNRAIYVLTQERLLERTDISSIDLLVVDEFYKMDPSRQDSRHEVLNIAV